MDKFNAMRCFERVADLGSFSVAARQLGRSKATVSKLVAELEGALGVQLLVRSTRHVRLTEAGREYHERCRQLLADLDDLESRVRREDAELAGVLRIAAPRTFTELYLASFVGRFVAQHPALRVEFTLTDGFVDLVGDTCDVAVRVGTLDDSSLVARRLAVSRVVCCAAPDYLARQGTPSTVQALAEHALIADTNIRPAGVWRFAGGHSLRVQGHVAANSALFVRELLLQGSGIGLVPAFVVGAELAAGRLQELPFVYEPRRIGVYAVYPQRRHLSTRVRTLVDALVAWFAPGLEADGRR